MPESRPITAHSLRALVTAGLIAAAPDCLVAQTRTFVFSQVPGAEPGMPHSVVFGDIGYGQRMFAALGPEMLEQRLGGQFELSQRISLLVQGARAAASESVRSRTMAQAEVFASIAPVGSRAILALGVGSMRDYLATNVITGRVMAGYRWANTSFISNLRLEHPMPSSRLDAPVRDALDVNTSLGLSHDVSRGLRVGFESVAEDLEGLVDTEETEGGAKLMIGPSVGVGSRQSRWALNVVAGPVMRLGRSTITTPVPGAARGLSTASGYVVRTSLAWRW